MAQDFAKEFYHSRRWRRCRAAYIAERIKIDGGLCEICQERQGYIVHHKIMLTQENISNPCIALNHDHLAYVCKPCHDLEEGHGVRRKDLPLLRFDERGDPIPP